MQVARTSCRRPLALVVSPTRNAASPFGRSHAVTIAFADPERAPEADTDLLARLYGLTPREAAVAALLLRGCSPNEAADELAMTQTRRAPISAASLTRQAPTGSPTWCGSSCKGRAFAGTQHFSPKFIIQSHQFW